MAKALLGFERIFLGAPRQSAYALSRLKILADRMGAGEDPLFQDRYTKLRLELEDLKALYDTYVAKLRRGETARPRRLDAEGDPDRAVPAHHRPDAGDRRARMPGCWSRWRATATSTSAGLFIQSRPATIYGGSNEIQRNIVSKNVLGMPG